MAPSTPTPTDFILFPQGSFSQRTTREAINTIGERRRVSHRVPMTYCPQTPTSSDLFHCSRPNPLRNRQQETHIPIRESQHILSKDFEKSSPTERNVHWSTQKELPQSMPINMESDYTTNQLLSSESPTLPSLRTLKASRRRRNKVLPAAPKPPRPRRLPTPELSDVEENDFFGYTQGKSYSKLDAQGEFWSNVAFTHNRMLTISSGYSKPVHRQQSAIAC